MLTISKGFFEGAIARPQATAVGATSTGPTQLASSVLQVQNVDLSAAGKTWDDDANLDIDDDGVIKSGGDHHENGEAGGDDDEDGGDKGWDVDDGELEIPADLVVSPSSQDKHDDKTSGFFVAPTRGTALCQVWCNNSKLHVDHILAGSFESAMRLLHDQIGVVDFAEYKSLFMQVFVVRRTLSFKIF